MLDATNLVLAVSSQTAVYGCLAILLLRTPETREGLREVFTRLNMWISASRKYFGQLHIVMY